MTIANTDRTIDMTVSKDWQQDSVISLFDEISALAAGIELRPVSAIENIVDDIPSFWVDKNKLCKLMHALKHDLSKPFDMCFDLSAVDETERQNKANCVSDFTINYHLRSHQRNQDIRLKVAINIKDKNIDSVCSIWANANWYEREV